VRTTIDLPDDLHRLMTAIANDRRQSLSHTVAEVLRRALQADARSSTEVDPATNLPLVRLGRTITSEDVRSLEDE
jgi:hypothetical protein